jgi:hypothetical protein
MGYSKAWARGAYKQPAIASARDPDHRSPGTEDTGKNWQAGPSSPAVMPVQTIDNTSFSLDAAPGGIPWNPAGPDTGVGFGAGLSYAASSAQNDAARSSDDGSVSSRLWQAPADRDGQYHVDRVQLVMDDTGLDHQAQIDLGKQLNRQAYPNRRTGHRITRWTDRVYERRNWSTEFRATITPTAYTAPPLTQVDQRSKYVSPYPDAVAANVRVMNTVGPQLRRTPKPWDQTVTQDGTASSPWADPTFTAWGL